MSAIYDSALRAVIRPLYIIYYYLHTEAVVIINELMKLAHILL